MAKIAIIYHSGYGHTERVAQTVYEGAKSVHGVEVIIVRAADAKTNLDQFDSCDTIIFGCPTYMGGPSADFKSFADATVKKWMKHAWKDKLAAGFTNSGGLSGDKLLTLEYFVVFASQHAMLWISQGEPTASTDTGHGAKPEAINRLGSFIGVMTQSDNAAPANTPSSGDLETARRYGKRIAEITKRWTK